MRLLHKMRFDTLAAHMLKVLNPTLRRNMLQSHNMNHVISVKL